MLGSRVLTTFINHLSLIKEKANSCLIISTTIAYLARICRGKVAFVLCSTDTTGRHNNSRPRRQGHRPNCPIRLGKGNFLLPSRRHGCPTTNGSPNSKVRQLIIRCTCFLKVQERISSAASGMASLPTTASGKVACLWHRIWQSCVWQRFWRRCFGVNHRPSGAGIRASDRAEFT